MSSEAKTPKTGLTGRMRAWMAAQGRKSFTRADISIGLDIPPGPERECAGRMIRDFLRRGEISTVSVKRKQPRNAGKYRYNPAWKKATAAPLADKIYKAMRIISFSQPFALSDIESSTDQDRSHIYKTARDLVKRGYLREEGFRRRKSSYGRETIYRIIDTDKFFVEVMK